MKAILLLVALMIVSAALGQTPTETKAQKDARMKWWREARFGMFIHWGIYSVPAGEWGGKTNYAEWIMESAHIPVDQYEKFRDGFNPTKFNADDWAKMAKDAGMQYVVITTKHHDGFALFDSKAGPYNVMSTPFHRDIMKELSTAVRKQGLVQCWYHSIMDWHHPDYVPHRAWSTKQPPDTSFQRYVDYLHQQVSELLTNYGPIGVMWFDGEWESTWNHEQGQALYDLCRKCQPSVIVNNRVDVGRGGMGGMSDEGFAGDFGTPEQEIPATGLPGVDWETCMTMNDNWGYNSHDKHFKSTEDLVRKLCDIASKGGNFLLNIGPKPDGTFPSESVQRLKEIGQWMKVNGESIYGTTASPFKSLAWGRCTQKPKGQNTVLYLHVFDWPTDGKLVVPGIGNKTVQASLLGSNGHLRQDRNGPNVIIDLPKEQPNSVCPVVSLEIENKPIVFEAPLIEASSDILVGSLPIKLVASSPSLSVRYTLDGSEPNANSPEYKTPLSISATTTVKACSVYQGKVVSSIVTKTFKKVNPHPQVIDVVTGPGVLVEVLPGDYDNCGEMAKKAKSEGTVAATIAMGSHAKEEYIGLRYTGYIEVPKDDVYEFSLTSDDGSQLMIDGEMVVDNDGLHSSTEKRGTIALAKGKHSLMVLWFNKTGGTALDLKWAPVGEGLVPLAAPALWH